MITTEEIRKLAHLARIEVSDEEMVGYAKDLESILAYVHQISNVDVSSVEHDHIQANSSREDANPNEPGQYVDTMLAEAPASEHGFYKVPKIL